LIALQNALTAAVDRLRSQSDSAALDAEILLAFILDKPRSYLRAWPEYQLTASQHEAFVALVEQRLQGMPIAYLTGTREFWSRAFKITPAVLIPRPDTELLIELSLALLPINQSVNVLDLGTGSGIIAVTLAIERPLAHISACDSDAEALAVAQDNAYAHNADRIRFYLSDWFNAMPAQSYDLIVGNPPYIAPDDPHLQQNGLNFEPVTALCAQDEGLADIKNIIDHARRYLCPGGCLLLEHGFDQSLSVQAIFNDLGYHSVRTVCDLGGHPRVTAGQMPIAYDLDK
jgi:release factor glutamine methyltransferase